ncbi:hypothetical protein NDU88_005249, partial [Pleurodeles waltl]
NSHVHGGMYRKTTEKRGCSSYVVSQVITDKQHLLLGSRQLGAQGKESN